MQNDVIIKDFGRFEEIINGMESSYSEIKKIIEKEYKNVEIINETPTWTGACANSMYNKYKQLNKNYELIDYSIDLYIKFLKKTLEDYRRMDEELGNNIDSYAAELDVHS